jgi:L,D-peptidoglycan transpeptidase YkuD (ErfK/YbiS/YcfS/YnhG family)
MPTTIDSRAWPTVTIARGLTALAVLAGVVALSPAASAATPGDLPGAGSAEQVIVVTSTDYRSTRAQLSAYEKSTDGSWRTIAKDIPAFVGARGIVAGPDRRQGTNTTPAGTYAITSGFGRKPDPGTAMPYVHVDRDDAWTYNPKVPSTYNVFQTAPVSWASYGGYVERLWKMGRQYDYVAVLDYNLPGGTITTDARGIRRTDEPADTRAGGGIFLHVSKGEPTAGCISINKRDMRRVMDWLDLERNPVIVIGKAKALALD